MKTPDERFFIALIPPEPLFQQIHQLKVFCFDHFQTKAALRSPPHLTLHMPFLWPLKKVNELVSSFSLLAKGLTPVTVHLNGFGSFPPRVIYLNVSRSPELNYFQQKIIRHCRQSLNLFNADYRDLPFHPHITIAFRDLKKKRFPEAWQEFSSKEFTGRFEANAFSLLKHDGKEWKDFERFPLGM